MKVKFEIWAPKVNKMSLCIESTEGSEGCKGRENVKSIGITEKLMKQCENGFWRLELETNIENPLYGYKIDDKGPFPDPKSRFQPDGVHGLSQLWIDDFSWNDNAFTAVKLSDAIIYELHTGTFTPEGTFLAIIEKLDHLINIGVTHIEIMPIASFPGINGWGYDGVALYAPHRGYGNPTELKQLVDACHQKGIAVILDVVYNHLGPDGNYLGLFGHYFSDCYHTPWGEAVNFDGPHSDEVRKFVIENALYWLKEFHFDGLRLDAIHAIFDFSATHILEELQTNVERLSTEMNKELFLIAESSLNDPRTLRPREKGGCQLASQWLDDFHHSLHVMFTQEQFGYYQGFKGAEDFSKCLQNNFVYDGIYAPNLKRRHGRKADDLRSDQFVVSLQNHDQTGNRAFGERLCHLISFEDCQIATAFFLLSPFVPMLFQGEEWSSDSPFLYFTDHVDRKLAKAVTKGRRKEFPHKSAKVSDPQAYKTFLKSKLNWDEIADKKKLLMLNWHRDLIKIRKENLSQIRNEKPVFFIIDDIRKIYSYASGNVLVFANCGETKFALDDELFTKCEIILQNKDLESYGDGMALGHSTVIVLKVISDQ